MRFLLFLLINTFSIGPLAAQSDELLTDQYTQETFICFGMEEDLNVKRLNAEEAIRVEYPVFREQALVPKAAILNKSIRELFLALPETDSFYTALQQHGRYYQKTCYSAHDQQRLDTTLAIQLRRIRYHNLTVFAHVATLDVEYNYADQLEPGDHTGITFHMQYYFSLDDGKLYRTTDFFLPSAIPVLLARLKSDVAGAFRSAYPHVRPHPAPGEEDDPYYDSEEYFFDPEKVPFTMDDFSFSINPFRGYFYLSQTNDKIPFCEFSPLPYSVELAEFRKMINPRGPLKRLLQPMEPPLPGIRNVNLPQQYERLTESDVLKHYISFSPYDRAPVAKLRSLSVYHTINESEDITDTVLYPKAKYFYDAAGFMTGYHEYFSKDTTVYHINTCAYNSKGLLTSIRSHSSTDYGAWSKTMEYDSRNNLISLTEELVDEASVTRYLYTGRLVYQLTGYLKKDPYHRDYLLSYILNDAGKMVRSWEESFVYAGGEIQQRYRTNDSLYHNNQYTYERVNGISRVKQINRPGVLYYYLYNDYNQLLRIACVVGREQSAYEFKYSHNGLLQNIFYYEPNSNGPVDHYHFQYEFRK